MEKEKIDFVVTWVDDNDAEWLAEKHKWERLERSDAVAGDANADFHYRDNGWMRYWFRSVERFAPWVNKIHFVTCGQKPDWLVEDHPKLHLVNHEDFMPSRYLPTFCSRSIELNAHRIAGLSDHFVLFNDDVFLLQPVTPEFFFKGGNPVLISNLRYPDNLDANNIGRVVCNDYFIINSVFDIGKSIWTHRGKWFNGFAIGHRRALHNFFCFLANRTLPVGFYGHLSLPHLKSTFEEVWESYPDLMDNTCLHKFRTDDQINQYLLCAWNQAKGLFSPTYATSRGICVTAKVNATGWICEVIRKQSAPQICINDSDLNSDSMRFTQSIADAFETLFPEKSGFEKQ